MPLRAGQHSVSVSGGPLAWWGERQSCLFFVPAVCLRMGFVQQGTLGTQAGAPDVLRGPLGPWVASLGGHCRGALCFASRARLCNTKP